MKNHILFIFSIILIGLFFSCASMGTGVGNAEQLVPANAIIYIEATNTEALIANAESFLKNSGLSGFLQGLTLKETILKTLESTGYKLEWFNLNKPAGITVLPPDSRQGKTDYTFGIFLPLSSDSVYDELIKVLTSLDVKGYKKIGSYVVLTEKKDQVNSFPPQTSLPRDIFKSYAKGSVSAYVNIPAFYRAANINWVTIKAKLIQQIETGSISEEYKEYKSLLPFAVKAIEAMQDLDYITTNISLDSKGISVSNDFQFDPDSWVAEFGKKVKSKGDIKALSKYLSSESLFSFLTTGDFPLSDDLIDALVSITINQLPENIDTIAYKDIMKKIYKNGGTFSAASLDINLNKDVLATIDNIDIPDLKTLQTLFSIKGLFVDEVKDIKLYKDYLQQSYSTQLTDSINTLLQDKGMKFNIIYSSDKIDNEFKYDELSLKIDFDAALIGEKEFFDFNDNEFTDEDYSDEDYSDEDYSDEDYSDEDYSDEDYSDEDYSDEDYSDEDYSDEDYSDEDYSDEDYSDEGYNYDLNDQYDDDQEQYSSPSPEEIVALINGLIDSKVKIFFHFKGNKVYMYVGDNDINTLKEYVLNEGIKNNADTLSGSEILKEIWPLIPSDSIMVGNFSLVKMLNLIAVFPDSDIKPLNLSGMPGLIGQLSVSKNIWKSTMYWSVREIKAILQSDQTLLLEILKELK